MSRKISLKDRHADSTRELILTTAIELLESSGVTDLTVRAVAKQAGMSERTIFRYFATRDDFLDAVAAAVAERMQSQAPPGSIEELLGLPSSLYRGFEKRSALVEATLHTEIFKRVRATVAEDRWKAVEKIIGEIAPQRSAKERKVAATNINYYLSATTWHYLRTSFGLSLADTIACAQASIRLTLSDMKGK